MQDEVGDDDEHDGNRSESVVEPLGHHVEELGNAEESGKNNDGSADLLCKSESARIILIGARLAHLANVSKTQGEEKCLHEDEEGADDETGEVQIQKSIDAVFPDKNATGDEIE